MAKDLRVTTTVARVLRAFLEDPTSPQYGFDLMQSIKISSGSLYPVLARLEQAGWIIGKREHIDEQAAGRPARRYYLLTAEGKIRAHASLAALADEFRLPTFRPRMQGAGGMA